MKYISILAAFVCAFVILANPSDLVGGKGGCAAFASTRASDCEKNYREQLKALDESTRQARKAEEDDFRAEEDRLKAQLGRARKSSKRAVRELHDPNKDQQARCTKLYDKAMATERQITAVIDALYGSRDDAAWQAGMAKIAKLRKESDKTEAQWKSCRAQLKAARVPYGARQQAMLDRFKSESAIGSLLGDLRSRHQENVSAIDASHARDVEKLNRQRDYCGKHNVWLGPSQDRLNAGCACEIRTALGTLMDALREHKELNGKIRAAALEYEIQVEDFVDRLKSRIAVKSAGLDNPLTLAGVKLAAAVGEFGHNAAGGMDAALKVANKLIEIDGDKSPLVDAFRRVAAQREKLSSLFNRLRDTKRRENAIWQQIAAMKCLKAACKMTPARTFSLSTDRAGRTAFVKTAFGDNGPLRRLLLASGRLCNPCEAMKALYDLAAHRKQAHDKVDELDGAIADNLKTIATLNRDLLKFLSRDKPSEAVAKSIDKLMARLVGMDGFNGWGYLGGTIALGLALPPAGLAAGVSEAVYDAMDAIDRIPLLDTIPLLNKLPIYNRFVNSGGARGRGKRDIEKDVRQIESFLSDSQTARVYWRHYARSLDDQMEQALQRLMNSCLKDACDKVARTNPQTPTPHPAKGDAASDMGPPGHMNLAPGDHVSPPAKPKSDAQKRNEPAKEPARAYKPTGDKSAPATPDEINRRLGQIPDEKMRRRLQGMLSSPDTAKRLQALDELGFNKIDIFERPRLPLSVGVIASSPPPTKKENEGPKKPDEGKKHAALQPAPDGLRPDQVKPFTRAELDARREQINNLTRRMYAALEKLGAHDNWSTMEASFKMLREIEDNPTALRAQVKKIEAFIARWKVEKPNPITETLISYYTRISRSMLALAEEVQRRSVAGTAGDVKAGKREAASGVPGVKVPEPKLMEPVPAGPATLPELPPMSAPPVSVPPVELPH